MRFKIVPEIIEGRWIDPIDRKVFAVYYKIGFLDSWKTWWWYDSIKEASDALPRIKEAITERIEKERREKEDIANHLNQKVITGKL